MTQGTVGGRRVRHITRTRGLRLRVAAAGDWGSWWPVLLGLSWVGMGHGAPGDLDPTFGTGGMAITFGPSDLANALIVQPDGKLVVAGISSGDGVYHVLLVRYLSDGRVDGSFGPGGKVITSVGTGSGANALLQQPDGKLVVVGFSTASMEAPSDVLLARYLPDGRLDASFGVTGVVTTDFGGSDGASALVQQPDGKLVVAGGSGGNTLLARYHPDGRLDDAFGVGGKMIVNLGGPSNGASALLIQPDGKLVVTGSAGASRVTPPSLVIARFQPNGSLDPTFGQGGQVTFASPSAGQALILQPDGKLVVTGSGAGGALLARYLPDGRLDSAFGAGGVVRVPALLLGALIQQPDGKLVVGGYRVASGNNDMLLARYLPDGRLDSAFGVGGLVITDVGGHEIGSGLVQQPDGKLVAAGWFSMTGGTSILLARYQALGCPAADPDPCLASLADFVTDVYLAALARQPDAGEVDYWVDVLATEPTLDTVRGMLHAVFDGPEFRQRPGEPLAVCGSPLSGHAGAGARPGGDGLVGAGGPGSLQHATARVCRLHRVPAPGAQLPGSGCRHPAGGAVVSTRPAAGGQNLAGWTQAIITWCAVEEGVEDFFNSLEYLAVPRTLADHVTVLYRALLAREPDAGGLAKVGGVSGRAAGGRSRTT